MFMISIGELYFFLAVSFIVTLADTTLQQLQIRDTKQHNWHHCHLLIYWYCINTCFFSRGLSAELIFALLQEYFPSALWLFRLECEDLNGRYQRQRTCRSRFEVHVDYLWWLRRIYYRSNIGTEKFRNTSKQACQGIFEIQNLTRGT